METKNVGLKCFFDSFHQTSCNFVGISIVVCGSFWGVEKIQNVGRCHGNQGVKNVKFTPNSYMKFDERNQKHFNPTFFVSMATVAKFVQLIPIFLAYLVPLDVDVVTIKFRNKNRSSLKLCSLFLKFSKWPTFQNGHQYKNSKNR
jgi:hypothetical protein